MFDRKVLRQISGPLRWLAVLVTLAAVLAAGYLMTPQQPTAEAQGANLLTNGSMERPYYGQGASTRTAPNGWNLWVGGGAPEAFPHTDQVNVRDGEVSWNIKQGYVAFTVAGWQTVSGLQPGENVTLRAYGWVYTCNNTENSCIIPDPPYRQSDTAAGALLRVGIDPNGGTNPLADSVVWSASAAPYDQWAEMSVTATPTGGSVTVFLYATQTSGLALNNVYWDAASLTGTTAPADSAPANATPTPQSVPFVTPQNVRPDGSIIHVVQAGDTLSSIAFAYSDYGVTNLSIAELNGLRENERFLTIGQELLILPPGSVDPQTGQLLAPGQQPSGQAVADAGAPPQQPTPQPSADQPPADQPPAGESGDDGDAEDPDEMVAANYEIARVQFLAFERGFMFGFEGDGQIYVLTSGEGQPPQGTLATYLNTWTEGKPEIDENLTPPTGFAQPERGFGELWRNVPTVETALGWAVGSTVPYTALVVREGQTVIVNGPDNRVYRLNLEEENWSLVDYFAP